MLSLRQRSGLRSEKDFCILTEYFFTLSRLSDEFQFVFYMQVRRLPTESTYSPTPLLKLIHVWSKDARSASFTNVSECRLKASSRLSKACSKIYFFYRLRYFPLLAKQKPDHPECDILLNVFALLSAKKVSPATIAVVMDIAEYLATAADFVASETETELSVNGCVFPQPAEGALIAAG